MNFNFPSKSELRNNLWLARGSIWLATTCIGIWFVCIPWKVSVLGISESQLGYVIMVFGVGSLVSIQTSNTVLLAKFCPESLTKTCVVIFPFAFFAFTTSRSYLAFLATAFPLSITFGVLNSSVLSSIAHYEKLSDRRLMPIHMASFSIGGLVGSVIGGLLIEYVDNRHLALGLVAGLALNCGIVLVGMQVSNSALEKSKRTAGWPSSGAVYLGIIAAANIGTTGIIVDWSALWLTRDWGVSAAFGGAIVFSYYVGEIVGRLFGERIIDSFGERIVGSYFVVIGCLVLGAALYYGNVIYLIASFFPLGLLSANFFPLLMGFGAQLDPNQAQKNIGDINVISFVGLIVGPTAVGLLAETYSIELIMYILALSWAALSLAVLPFSTNTTV